METIEVIEDHLTIFYKYVGYDKFEDFLEEHPSIDDNLKRIQLGVFWVEKGDLSELSHEFIGYYYSDLNGASKTKTFNLKIDFANESQEGFPVEVIGLHTINNKDIDKTKYKGFAIEKESCLYFDLSEDV